ncbi:MAG TPA: CPBP family glutamic-type intramembrane protease [Candidatus Saccharimonadales bacterium]|nr:CPBP family glutamic-type intramembrane protease [Candidatus Saccharimonadales bacterium]
MHRRARGAAIPAGTTGRFFTGFLSNPFAADRWIHLKAEAIEHKQCIAAALTIIGSLLGAQMLLLSLPAVGAAANALSLVLLVGLTLRRDKLRSMFVAASVVPMAVFAALALPQHSNAAQAAVLYGTLAALALAYRRMLPTAKSRKKKTKPNYLFAVPAMLATGAVLGTVSYAIVGDYQSLGAMSLPFAAGMLAGFAVIEEFYFRGVLQRYVRQDVGPTLSVAVAVAAFTALTLPAGNIGLTAVAFITSTTLSVAYRLQTNLILTTVTNVTAKLTLLACIALVA